MLEGKLLTAFKQGQAKIQQEFTALTAKNGPFFTRASAEAPAFPVKQTESCGLKGGC
jgi:hypothetical protein